MGEMKKLAGVLAVAIVVAWIVGCGGSDGGSTPTISAGLYRTKVNQLCTETENKKYKEIGVAFRESGKKSHSLEEEDLARIVSTVIVPVFEEMTQKLRQMPLPAGHEKEATEVIDKYEADTQKTKSEPQRFIEGSAFTEGNEAAKDFGLSECVF
jgi:hypothetical protein